MRKTKVRIVGDPDLAREVANAIKLNFVLDGQTDYPRAVGRDYSHSEAPGLSIYIGIKTRKRPLPVKRLLSCGCVLIPCDVHLTEREGAKVCPNKQ